MSVTAMRDRAIKILRPPPRLDLVAWADTYRGVASATSASPGKWRTSAQPAAYGPMAAVTSPDVHTVTVMSATQVLKTELLINVAGYYIAQDPSPILFVQPTQSSAESFSKERFTPTVEVTPQIAALIGSDETVAHKNYPGGNIDFVGSNSPTDLASRPKRIILADEVDKYGVAGSEGDALKLAEERASTYHAIGRAKFVRTCSPTVKGLSRIAREYEASDQRRLFVTCPHCQFEQTLTWANMRWDKDGANQPLPETAALSCYHCGVLWTERERVAALDALAAAPGYGWKQTRPFSCCDELQEPRIWDDEGRSLCWHCKTRSPFNGHAGFVVSKLYSKRHRMPELVREFLEAKADAELLRKWTNTCLAEVWEPQYYGAALDTPALMARAESYDGSSLPEAVKVITAFCDVQGDRLEVLLVGWGSDEECWPFQFEIIHLSPAEPHAWRELDALLRRRFKTVTGRELFVAACGVDTGGHHGDIVLTFCSQRRGRRIFATKGIAGPRPIWNARATKSKNHSLYLIGVDTAKEAVYARLAITPPEPGQRKPGYVHFPVGDNFGPEFFDQLNSERRQVVKKMGQHVVRWVKIRERNEALDCFVGALAMRKALPRFIDRELGYDLAAAAPLQPVTDASTSAEQPHDDAVRHQALARARARQTAQSSWVGNTGGWFDRGGRRW